MATFTGTEADDALIGGEEDDLLEGLGGNDVLDGAAGFDTLVGGAGDDRLIVGETLRQVDGVWEYLADEAVEEENGGADTVVWTGIGGYRIGANLENLEVGTRFGGSIWGNDLANVVVGWNLGFDSNWLRGEGGDDTLIGGLSNDTLEGGEGDDTLFGFGGGVALDASLDNDVLDGGAGADTMAGGDGYDSYWADDLGDVIVELATPEDADDTTAYYYGQDAVYWTGQGGYVLAGGVETMHLRGGSDQAFGNDDANVFFIDYGSYDNLGNYLGDGRALIDARGGDDILIGGTFDDELIGGDGADRIEGGDGLDVLRGGAGDDTVRGERDAFFSVSNDTLFGDEGDDRLEGEFGDDVLDGGDGDDVQIGASGDDTMTGGAGLDRFQFGQGVDIVTDFADGEDLILGNFEDVTITQEGADAVIAFAGDPPADGSTLRLVGVDAALLTADDFVRYYEGTQFDDTVTGTDGDDYVSGGDGDDDVTGGGGDDGSDGGAGDDDVGGGGGDDDVAGGTGDDEVDGDGGSDEVDGGTGDDDVAGGGGDDEVDGGDGDDDVTGGGGDDELIGGDGDDWLEGGAGDDTYNGGEGDDVYVVTDTGDTATDRGGGEDVVESSVSFELGRGIEDLVLGDSASRRGVRVFARAHGVDEGPPASERLDGAGNRLDNTITGSSGANRLYGADGDDRLRGEAGDDRLAGGEGDDRLVGGLGGDVMRGGAGADVFVLGDEKAGDRIADFSTREKDVIQIRSATADAFDDLRLSRDADGDTLVRWSGGSVTVSAGPGRDLDARDFRFVSSEAAFVTHEPPVAAAAFHAAPPLTDAAWIAALV